MNNQAQIFAFSGQKKLSRASVLDVAMMLKKLQNHEDMETILLFDADSGRQLDLDLSGTLDEVAIRYRIKDESEESPSAVSPPRKARGRPKLGVTGKEVTLLPRHWEWLEQQRGGASATLRRLIDQARRDLSGQEQIRQSQDAAQRFMTALAGNLPGYEEAVRALYARNKAQFDKETANWPVDIRTCAREFAEHALV